MLTTLLTFAVAASTVSAIPSPTVNQNFQKRADGGFTLKVNKRDIASTLDKRAPLASINDRWWITLSMGTPPQELNFLPDTGSNTFSVGSTLLPANSRGNAFYYNPNISSTAQQVNGYTYAEYFTGYNDSGVVFQETFAVADTTYTQVPICVQTQASSPNYNGRSGNLGLNRDYNGQSTSPTRLPAFMQAVRSKLPSWLFTTSYNTYTNTGEIDFGFIDQSKYTGTLTYANATDSGQWYTYFNGLVVNGNRQSFSFRVLIDTGGPSATLPRNVLDAYFSQVPSATFDSNQNTYVFPCNTSLPAMTFWIGSLNLAVPPASWVGNPIGSTNNCPCEFTVSPDAGAFLGEPFIEGVFLVFDLGNDRIGFANRPATTQTIPASPFTGTINLYTGDNFSGATKQIGWSSAACYNLRGTSVYHNLTSWNTNRGSCTIYNDTVCASPITGVTNIAKSYSGHGQIPNAASVMCLWPIDYTPYGSGEMQYCNGQQFAGNCTFGQWKSFACNPLPAAYVNKVGSAGPYPGYCTWYTDTLCANPIQASAPMAYPGERITPWGNKVGSYMCT